MLIHLCRWLFHRHKPTPVAAPVSPSMSAYNHHQAWRERFDDAEHLYNICAAYDICSAPTVPIAQCRKYTLPALVNMASIHDTQPISSM